MKSPIGPLVKALREDPEYRMGWHANIAMSVIDAIGQKKKSLNKKQLNRKELYEAVNAGTDWFLTLLCKE